MNQARQSVSLVLVLAAIACGAGGAPPPGVVPVASTAGTPGPSPASNPPQPTPPPASTVAWVAPQDPTPVAPAPPPSPSGPAVPPSTGPGSRPAFARGPDYALRPRDFPVRRTLAAGEPSWLTFKGAWVTYAPDGRSVVSQDGVAKHEPILRSDADAAGVPLRRFWQPAGTAFSPDSRLVATSDEDGTLAVFDVPSGQEKLRRGAAFKPFGALGSGKYVSYALGFDGPRTVVYHDGCRIHRLDVVTGETVDVGASNLCGNVGRSRNFTWMVGVEAYGLIPQGCGMTCYKEAYVQDSREGAVRKVVDGYFTAPRLSPVADRICLVRVPYRLTCVELASGAEEEITRGKFEEHPYWFDSFTYDETGTQLLYAIPFGSWPQQQDLFVADLASRTVRAFARVGPGTKTLSFLGQNRIIAYGYDGAVVYDLAQGWSWRLTPPGTQTDRVVPVPGSRRIVIGDTAAHELHEIELPP